ncbi:uncharacterized protein TNIN_209532 [Trichonephila inaurata madagascariensis]|nr:uncharacterized protein TNIN_209532 [Trichonephila inaurata madagascariensis]
MEIKVRKGTRLIFLHDSSKCRKCKLRIEFYRNVNKKKPSFREKGVKYRDMISYCFVFDVEVKSTNLNDVEKQSYEWPTRQSYDCFFNQWSLKTEIREKAKANENKYSGKEVKIDDTATEQPKTHPALLVSKEQIVDETNKINFVDGSPSSDNHVEDCNPSSSTRYSKIPMRKSYWRAAKDNAAKINIPTKESARTRKHKNITEDPESNESYEDDLYANKKFFKIPNMSEENSVCSEILDIATPAFPLTPEERSISPICEDCYDIAELNNCRKEAEKYQFRRNKRKWKKQTSSTSMKNENYLSPNERSETETKKRLLETIERLKQVKKDQDNEDSDIDYYYSDLDDEKENN